MLLSSAPAAFEHGPPPAWVAEWLAKRDASARSQAPSHPPGAVPPKRSSAPSRAASAREAKVAAGVAELGHWLRDLARQGLADAQSRPPSFWSAVAARMVDAQAPGLARMVAELATVAATGDGWQSRMLERLARIHLLLEGYRQIDELPAATQADLRAAIGWTQQQDQLLAGAGVRDHWLVLGQRVEEEDNLRTQRTWLWGQASNRPALALSFAIFNQPLDHSLTPGTAFDAELVFFPGSYPLRALVKQRFGALGGFDRLAGWPDLTAATGAYAAALALVPWIERFPLVLHGVIPERAGERWRLRDRDNRAVPLSPGFGQGWRLLALSGGHPLALFGEWDGTALLPLSAWANAEFYRL